MNNFTVTNEIELADEQLELVNGAGNGTYDSFDYNQIAKSEQENSASVSQVAAAAAGNGGSYIAGKWSGNGGSGNTASATNSSAIGQSNSNSQKLWYYWY